MGQGATSERTRWIGAVGHTPDNSTGHEAEFMSSDELCLLTATSDETCAEVAVYHIEREPADPYKIDVPLVTQLRHLDIRQPELGVAITTGSPGDA